MRKIMFLLITVGFFSSFSVKGDEIEEIRETAMKNVKKFRGMSQTERKNYVAKKKKEALRRGAKLYSDFGCASCHPKGGAVEGKVMGMKIPDLKRVADRFPEFKPANDDVITLSDMINNCVVMFTDRGPLPLNSHDMRSLTFFLSSGDWFVK